MNLSFRRAVHSDIPQLIGLGIRSYETHAAVLGAAGWSAMKASLSRPELYPEVLRRASGFVCESERQLVGMVFLVPSGEAAAHFPADWAHIRLLGVAPEYGGQGISRQLMQHCIDEARSLGEHRLGLHTGAFMLAARKLYVALGFLPDKELVPIFDQPYTRFRLDLRPEYLRMGCR